MSDSFLAIGGTDTSMSRNVFRCYSGVRSIQYNYLRTCALALVQKSTSWVHDTTFCCRIKKKSNSCTQRISVIFVYFQVFHRFQSASVSVYQPRSPSKKIIDMEIKEYVLIPLLYPRWYKVYLPQSVLWSKTPYGSTVFFTT